MRITPTVIRKALQEKMIDPELGINVVDLGLVYKINVTRVPQTKKEHEARSEKREVRNQYASSLELQASSAPKVHILMTLTTPGCPLAAVFGPMVRQALSGIPGLDPYKDVEIELTFDPPWHQGMMSERAKAEMGM